jgi:hypothetical protein
MAPTAPTAQAADRESKRTRMASPGHPRIAQRLVRSTASRKYLRSRAARVAELADALDLGSSGRKSVGVQLPPLAPAKKSQGWISGIRVR